MDGRWISSGITLTKGMDRVSAQSQFIREAERMGIAPVRWSKNIEPEPQDHCPWPTAPSSNEFLSPPPPVVPPPIIPPSVLPSPVDHPATVDHVGITSCSVRRKLFSRAESESGSAAVALPSVESTSISSDRLSALALWGGGLYTLSGVGLFLWMAFKKYVAKQERGNIADKSRIHARAWDMI